MTTIVMVTAKHPMRNRFIINVDLQALHFWLHWLALVLHKQLYTHTQVSGIGGTNDVFSIFIVGQRPLNERSTATSAFATPRRSPSDVAWPVTRPGSRHGRVSAYSVRHM